MVYDFALFSNNSSKAVKINHPGTMLEAATAAVEAFEAQTHQTCNAVVFIPGNNPPEKLASMTEADLFPKGGFALMFDFSY